MKIELNVAASLYGNVHMKDRIEREVDEMAA
jgi:hypothetical protein